MILVDEKIFCCHGGLSPDLQSMEQIRRIMRPTDVPDTGTLKGGNIPPPPTTEFVLPPCGLDFLSSSSHYQFPVILLSLPISCSLNFQCCGFIDFLSWNFGKITRNKNIRSIFLYIYGFFLSENCWTNPEPISPKFLCQLAWPPVKIKKVLRQNKSWNFT